MRKILTGLLLGAMLAGGQAYAAEVHWDGNAGIKYENDTMAGAADVSGFMYSLRLNGELVMGQGWSLYARLGAQYATEPGVSDYNTDFYDNDKKGVLDIDQFGLKYKTGTFVYKLGRQDVTIGAMEMLYSRHEDNVGRYTFVDGLSFEGKSGKADINGILAQEDNDSDADNRLYAVRVGSDVQPDLNLGVTLARYDYRDGAGMDTNHIGLDGTYKSGKHTWTMGLAKSNASVDNKAFAVQWNYDFNDNTSIYAMAYRVEPNADMGGQSDLDSNNRGFKYGIVQNLSKQDSVEVCYTNQKTLRDSDDVPAGTHNTKIEAMFSHTF